MSTNENLLDDFNELMSNASDEDKKKYLELAEDCGIDISRGLSDADKAKYPSAEDGFYTFNSQGQSIPQHIEFADYVVDKYNLLAEEAFAYLYKAGFYTYIGKTAIDNMILSVSYDKIKPYHMDSFRRVLLAKAFGRMQYLKDTNGMINLNNGILDVQNNRLIDHSPRYFFKYKLEHDYKPGAKCPKFMSFLNDIFAGSQELIDLTAEIFGYSLIGGEQWLHKAFVLYGDGRNGKSTYLEILSALLGHHNITACSLANLHKPFSVVSLDGKLANILDETPNDTINSEAFKTATSSGLLRASHKGKEEFDLRCDARFLFAANNLPKFKDTSRGVIERLYFIPFEVYIEPEKRDHKLKSKIVSTELEGILNFAIEGLARLLEREQLPDTYGHERIMRLYRKTSDSVFEFVDEIVDIDTTLENHIDTRIIFDRYRTFCELQGNPIVKYRTFVQRFKAILVQRFGTDKARDMESKTRETRGYKHVILSSMLH